MQLSHQGNLHYSLKYKSSRDERKDEWSQPGRPPNQSAASAKPHIYDSTLNNLNVVKLIMKLCRLRKQHAWYRLVMEENKISSHTSSGQKIHIPVATRSCRTAQCVGAPRLQNVMNKRGAPKTSGCRICLGAGEWHSGQTLMYLRSTTRRGALGGEGIPFVNRARNTGKGAVWSPSLNQRSLCVAVQE